MAETIAADCASAPSAPAAILLDIEGTTTSISFVKDLLFPYATENVEKFLHASWEDAIVQSTIDGMRKQAEKDVEAKVDGAVPIPGKDVSKEDLIEAISKNLKWLISIDNKGTYMKELSGFIWKKGYEAGEIKGHLYEDVRPAIQNWKNSGRKIFIYSSGSVQAQRLLMKYSTAGDLEPLIDDYFDTNVGNKREADSYKTILEKINFKPEETLFLTDIVEEGNAAKETGIKVVLLAREGNAELSKETRDKYSVVKSFTDVPITLKRKSSLEEPPSKIPKVEETSTKETAETNITEEKMQTDDVCEIKLNGASNESKVNGNNDQEIKKTGDIEDGKPDEIMVEESLASQLPMTDIMMPEKTEKEELIDKKTENPLTNIELAETVENHSNGNDVNERVPDLIETVDSPITVQGKPNEVITDVTDIECNNPVVSESPDLDIAPTIDTPMENDEEEKLNELLGEKGIALEKECEEILSKVAHVTNINTLDSTKKIQDNAEVEAGEDSNSKVSEDNVINSNEQSTKITPIPSAESNSETKEPTKVDEEICKNNGQVNCDEKESLNGNGTHSENGNGTHSEKDNNGTDESVSNGCKLEVGELNCEQAEIIVKKINKEDVQPETSVEQTVET